MVAKSVSKAMVVAESNIVFSYVPAFEPTAITRDHDGRSV